MRIRQLGVRVKHAHVSLPRFGLELLFQLGGQPSPTIIRSHPKIEYLAESSVRGKQLTNSSKKSQLGVTCDAELSCTPKLEHSGFPVQFHPLLVREPKVQINCPRLAVSRTFGHS
jgi:hypothetical protein